MINIAIPKLITSLKSPNPIEKRKAAGHILEITKKNPSYLKTYISNIESAKSDSDPELTNKIKEALKYLQNIQK
jgi:hypothetical protein